MLFCWDVILSFVRPTFRAIGRAPIHLWRAVHVMHGHTLLLKVHPAHDVAVLEHVLVALLELLAARGTDEAAHVVHIGAGAHHQFALRDGEVARETAPAVQPANR
jgi:hypothetical protein